MFLENVIGLSSILIKLKKYDLSRYEHMLLHNDTLTNNSLMPAAERQTGVLSIKTEIDIVQARLQEAARTEVTGLLAWRTH